MEGLINKMRNILRDPSHLSRGLALGTAKKTSSKRHIPGGLLPGHGRMRSGHQSLGGIAASPASLINKRFTLPFLALLAALAMGLLFLLPGGLLQAQSAEQFFTYPENGDGPVATFTASDPEGAMPVVWSLPTTPVPPDGTVVSNGDIADAASFKIDQNGVLRFRTSPSYEPRGDDDYRVTVEASDGNQSSYYKVYVNVTDEEETGKVTWSVDPDGTPDVIVPEGVVLRQFQPGAMLDASVTDPDAVATGNEGGNIDDADVTWKWYRGSSVIADEADESYTVLDSDVGNTIRVMATYSDGSGSEESVSLTSASVQAFRRSNDAPEFAPSTVSRRIAENSTGNIGGPVAATDANGDTLTYAFGTTGTDNSSFRIDPATGQLMVGPGLMIDSRMPTTLTTATRLQSLPTTLPAPPPPLRPR